MILNRVDNDLSNEADIDSTAEEENISAKPGPLLCSPQTFRCLREHQVHEREYACVY